MTRVVVCSGKVYYDLIGQREKLGTQAVAVVRLEQLYPWPEEQLKTVLGRYRRARDWVWVQEESQNMGAWHFVEPRLRTKGFPFAYVGRDESASPATGSHHVHEVEQKELVDAAFGGDVPPHHHEVRHAVNGANGHPKQDTSKVKGDAAG